MTRKIVDGLGSAPKTLNTEGKRLWRELKTVAGDMLTNLDRTAVEICCRSYAEYLDASEKSLESVEPEDKIQWMKVSDLARKAALQSLANLGLTPLARQKLGIVLPKGGDLEDEEPETGGEVESTEPRPKSRGKVASYVT